MKNFFWNNDTLVYFKELKNMSEDTFLREVVNFVKYECDLENGETYEDLQVSLINQVNEL
tara:strand:+ start:411 stop:590 length:180 start_codon:yes stop_codon:yes gene_type:complete